MKTKIIGILVCMMLLTTFLTTAQNIGKIPVDYKFEENNSILFNEGQVPVWKFGDMWIYKVNEFTINFEKPNLSIYINGKIEDLPLEVTEVTEDSYELTFKANISGSYKINMAIEEGPINITGKLDKTTIEGFIIYNKTDLGIKQINAIISGMLTIDVDHPFFDFSFLPDYPISVINKLDINIDKPYPIIEFSLNDTKCWGLPAVNFTMDGTIESPWLDFIDWINRQILNPLLSFLEKWFPNRFSKLKEISDVLLDILPVIDICKLFTNYLGIGCEFEIPEIPPIICYLNKDWVKVPAGTFEAYNISIMGSNLANIYYNDTVGNIIKIKGNLQDIFPSISNIDVELISYIHDL
jgi:hypothetical protein